ncbi:MAG: TolC family protein [Candidatus Hydrogenedentales bacterium]
MMKVGVIGIAILACTGLVCAGCALHAVNPQPAPLFDVPAIYSAIVEEGSARSVAPWWEVFDDPRLNELDDTALAQNFTLLEGLSRIERAGALLRQARAVRLPQVDFSGGLERSWRRDVGSRDGGDTDVLGAATDAFDAASGLLEAINDPSSAGVVGPGFLQEDALPDRDTYDTAFNSGVALTWEADLWGRLRAAQAAQSEEMSAFIHEYAALRLMLSAQIAETYFQIIEQQLQFDLLAEQRKLAETLLELLELRFLQGDASAVDLLQQRGQLAEIQSEVPTVLAQLGVLENRLDVLLGSSPDGQPRLEALERGLPEKTALPEIGVPLTLLQQRPDLQAQQRRIVAADYDIASAMAERLPQLTLDGSFGFNDDGGGFFVTGLVSAAVFQPLLDWGLRKAAVEVADTFFEEALLDFSQTYLLAMEEVESTLWQEKHQRDLIEALAAHEEILFRTVEEARVRYSLGVTDYLPVLTALQNLQDVQRQLLAERRRLVDLRIQLHRAVGGATTAATAPVEQMAETATELVPAAG